MSLSNTNHNYSAAYRQSSGPMFITAWLGRYRRLLMLGAISAIGVTIAGLYLLQKPATSINTTNSPRDSTVQTPAGIPLPEAKQNISPTVPTEATNSDTSASIHVLSVGDTTTASAEINGQPIEIPSNETGAITTTIEDDAGTQSEIRIEFNNSNSGSGSSHSYSTSSTSSVNISASSDHGMPRASSRSYGR